jgi:shikimate kinase
VQRENSTIPEIFKIHGETYFRNSERSVIQGLEKCSNAVIATGGGAPCFYDNIDLMNELGKTIYLRIDPGILASRLIINQQKRPLIAGKSKEQLREFIENKLREREPFYLKAHHIIEGKNIKVSDLDPLFKENKS